jgi:hypothetical protein
MPQLHVYVPKNLAIEVRRRAEALGLSVSRYLAQLLRREVRDEWPEDWFDRVVGGWQGEPLERPAQGSYEVRDELR